MDNEKQSVSTNLLKWATIVPGVLIFFGLITLFTYFLVFNIDILNYISLTDALISSINYLFITIPFSIYVWIDYMRDEKAQAIERKKLAEGQITEAEIANQDARKERNRKRFHTFQLWLSLVVAASNYVLYLFIGNKFYLLSGTILITLQAYSSGLSYILSLIRSHHKEHGTEAILFKQASILITVCVFFSLGTTTYAFYVKDAKSESDVRLITFNDKSDLILDSNLIYLKRIENFTFLYDRKLDEAMVLNNSDIKSYSYVKLIRGKQPVIQDSTRINKPALRDIVKPQNIDTSKKH